MAKGLSCRKHPDREATHVCDMCSAVWCQECIITKRVENSQIDLCPDCGGNLASLVDTPAKGKVKEKKDSGRERKAAMPVALDLHVNFDDAMSGWMYAARNRNLLTMGGIALVSTMAYALADILLPGFVFFLLLPTAVVLMYVFEAARAGYEGAKEYYDPLVWSNFLPKVLLSLLRFLVLLLAPLAALVGVAFLRTYMHKGAGVSHVLSLDLLTHPLMLLPMVIMVIFLASGLPQLGKGESIWSVASPANKLGASSKFNIILVTWGAVFGHLLFIYVLMVMGIKVLALMENIAVHWLVLMLVYYVVSVTLVALGYTSGHLYRMAEPLDETAVPRPRRVMTGNAAALPVQPASSPSSPASSSQGIDLAGDDSDALLYQARDQMVRQNKTEAARIYSKLLKSNPRHFEALKEFLDLLISLEHANDAKRVGRQLIILCMEQQSMSTAERVWRDLKNHDIKMELDQKQLMFVAQSLEESNMWEEAATVYKEVGQMDPKAEVAPQALLACAGLLLYKVERPDLAQKMAAYLFHNYGDPYKVQAKEILERIKTLKENAQK